MRTPQARVLWATLTLSLLVATGCHAPQRLYTRVGVTAQPAAEVFLDGQATGQTTPATLELRADGNLHRVSVECPQHAGQEALFYALPSKFQSSFHFDLERTGQGLRLRGVPWGAHISVFESGEVFWQDDAVDIVAPAGSIEVRIDLEGHRSWQRSFLLQPQQWQDVVVTLQTEGQGVRLLGPEGQLARVDGHGAFKLRREGKLLALAPGSHTLVVRCDGFLPQELRLEVAPGQYHDVRLQLLDLNGALGELADRGVVPYRDEGTWGVLLQGGEAVEDALLQQLREFAHYAASFRWGTRSWHALRAFVRIAPDSRGDELRDALMAGRSSPSPEAVEALRSFFDPIAVPTFEAAVAFGSSALVRAAAFSLGQLGAGSVVLRRRLDDPYLDAATVHALWSALADLGDAQAGETALGLSEVQARLCWDDVSARNDWGIDALRTGQPALAVDIFESATLDFPNESVFHYNLACGYALVGQKRRAIAALEKSVEARRGDWIYLLNDPDLASLRAEAGFQSLVAKLQRQAH